MTFKKKKDILYEILSQVVKIIDTSIYSSLSLSKYSQGFRSSIITYITKNEVIMKTIKNLFLIVPLLFSMSLSHGQEAEKTFVKSFNLKGAQVVLLDLDGKIEVKEWNNKNLMRVQINVGLENATEATLKSLVQAGRYNLKSNDETGTYKVSAPGLARKVIFRGNELQEKITYTVYAPENVTIKLNDEASTAVDPDTSSL